MANATTRNGVRMPGTLRPWRVAGTDGGQVLETAALGLGPEVTLVLLRGLLRDAEQLGDDTHQGDRGLSGTARAGAASAERFPDGSRHVPTDVSQR